MRDGDVARLESLAAQFHRIYQEEARRQGDVRHADVYADLPENIKEYDRVLARFVLARCEALEKALHLIAARSDSRWARNQARDALASLDRADSRPVA